MWHEVAVLKNLRKAFVSLKNFREFTGFGWSNMSGQSVTVNAKGQHSASVIFLHGLGDTGHGWAAGFAEIQAPHVKVICPNAPIQPVTLNGGMRMPSWFDIKSLNFDGPEDAEGVRESSRKLLELVAEEEKKGIPLDRIVIGGFSQGGAVALHAILTSGKPLGGVIALSTFLPLYKELIQCTPAPDVNVFQGHGTSDMIVNFKFGQMSSEILKTKFKNYQFKSYQDMGHSSCPEEMQHVQEFLKKVLPPL